MLAYNQKQERQKLRQNCSHKQKLDVRFKLENDKLKKEISSCLAALSRRTTVRVYNILENLNGVISLENVSFMPVDSICDSEIFFI